MDALIDLKGKALNGVCQSTVCKNWRRRGWRRRDSLPRFVWRHQASAASCIQMWTGFATSSVAPDLRYICLANYDLPRRTILCHRAFSQLVS